MTAEITKSPSPLLPIAVDAMGGDHGPKVMVEGAVEAARQFGISSVLVGDSAQLNALCSSIADFNQLNISVHHASEVIGMEESPALAIRGKADSSIRIAFELCARGEASAVVSSGNTGAIMAAGVFVGGTLPGIARPAIASLIPKGTSSTPTVLLDSGANTGCQAFQLVQFALMGHYYAVSALGHTKPRVALLSNGTEISKGNDIIRSAAMMLAQVEEIHFIGYVEGRDIARDVVDVVVCDGFVGNIVLKAVEGSAAMVFESIKKYVERSWQAKFGLWLARPALKALFREKLDPSSYGGAPLLGLGQIGVKCHGSSSGRAVMNGIRVAAKFAEEDMLGKLSAALSQLDSGVTSSAMDDSQGWSRVFEKNKTGRAKKVQPETGGSTGGTDG